MTRSELLRAVAAKIGRPFKPASLQYAQLLGEVDRGERLPDGWMRYNERHLQQVLAYCKKRAHRTRGRALSSR